MSSGEPWTIANVHRWTLSRETISLAYVVVAELKSSASERSC
ncbi:predicted protein [Plenodomus lingam JN3]|uniref:Predicted protein n=1 Tax=Leptosphaeria maculans (strain JN3 / isolate v23.1.3 / race Av1-4-5-6-7-8) TaxID=985895 RepID=E5A1I4_LEPMJ|nr:predicted protein [Plenodomus lingam JN3]CBX97448.1 predicted protein [Plenodomus lingam JN3]